MYGIALMCPARGPVFEAKDQPIVGQFLFRYVNDSPDPAPSTWRLPRSKTSASAAIVKSASSPNAVNVPVSKNAYSR